MIKLLYLEKVKTLAEWSRYTGIPQSTLSARYKRYLSRVISYDDIFSLKHHRKRLKKEKYSFELF